MKKKITVQGILIIVAAALLGITGTTVGVMALMGQSSAVTVDNFVGKTKKTVETWRTKNSIDSKQVSYIYKYDEEKDKDAVLKQRPVDRYAPFAPRRIVAAGSDLAADLHEIIHAPVAGQHAAYLVAGVAFGYRRKIELRALVGFDKRFPFEAGSPEADKLHYGVYSRGVGRGRVAFAESPCRDQR